MGIVLVSGGDVYNCSNYVRLFIVKKIQIVFGIDTLVLDKAK